MKRRALCEESAGYKIGEGKVEPAKWRSSWQRE